MTALDHNTMFAWRKTSFGRIRKVPVTEAERWQELAKPYGARKGRDWTHEELDHLVTLLDQGHDYDAIARRLGRTRTAIQVKVKRARCTMTGRPTVLTAREVAALLGKGCSKSVTRWISDGWLTARGAVCNGRRIWRICWDDLMAFLQDARYWPAWDPARISDADLRQELTALRADAGRWLSQTEIAARYCVTVAAVGQWIQKGWLRAVRYGNHLVNERDLDGWVPPCERSKAGIPKAMGRRVEGHRAIVAYERRAA